MQCKGEGHCVLSRAHTFAPPPLAKALMGLLVTVVALLDMGDLRGVPLNP